MNFNSRLPRHHLQVAQTLRAAGTLYILSLLFFERKDEGHHPMTKRPRAMFRRGDWYARMEYANGERHRGLQCSLFSAPSE